MAPSDALTDAETQYLAHIWQDCEGRLGPGARLLEVRHEPAEDGVRLVARYRLGEREHESAGWGETMLAAHTALRERILIDRIRFGYANLVEQR
ncbi:MAG TPA: hypothetical protein VIR16_07430 [Candidatus Limnocylindrales bacterium]